MILVGTGPTGPLQTLASVQALGLESELDDWMVTSTEHAYAAWKVTVEYLRLAAYVSGYEWWLAYDWAPVNNGLVSFTFQPKGHALAAHRIRNFVNPVVVLLGNGSLWKPSPIGNAGEHGYLSGQSIAPEVSVSNYAPNDLSGCTVSWTVQTDASATGATALRHNGSFGVAGAIEQGTVKQVGALSFSLDVTEPTRFRLELELRCDTATLPQPRPNDWTAWVYPAQPAPVSSPVPIFAPQPLMGLLAELGVVPHLQPMTLPGTSLPTKAVFLVQQDALADPALVEAIHGGATALLISYNHSGPHAVKSSIMPRTPPHNVIYHSPTWMQTTQTPASLIVNQASTTPASFRALATPSGWADSAFFEVFGPKQGRCGNFRWGKQWDVSKGIPGPLPPGDKCRNTEYPVDRNDGLCWKNSAGDKCGDWCVQNTSRCSPPNAPCACGCPGPDCYLRCCEISCPAAFPFPIQSSLGAGGNRGVLCYNDSKYIARGSGPCGSWCTRDPKVGGGCGSTSKLMCPEVARQCKSVPSPPPAIDQYGNATINVWLRVVSTADYGQPVQNMASVFESSIGSGHLIVSGLDLDLQSCSAPSERAAPFSVFAKWVAKALIQAAVDKASAAMPAPALKTTGE